MDPTTARTNRLSRLIRSTKAQDLPGVLAALRQLEGANELSAIDDADSSTGLSALLTAVSVSSPNSDLILQLLLLRGAQVYAGRGRDAREAALKNAHAQNSVTLLDQWEAQGASAWADSDAQKLLIMSAEEAEKWLDLHQATLSTGAEGSNAETTAPSFASPSGSPTLIASPSPSLSNPPSRTLAPQLPQTAPISTEPARIRVGRLPRSMTRADLENVFRWAEGFLGVELTEGEECGYASFASVFDARQAMATREGLSVLHHRLIFDLVSSSKRDPPPPSARSPPPPNAPKAPRRSLPPQRAPSLPPKPKHSKPPREQPPPDRRHRLYIGNVASTVTERALTDLLLEKGLGPFSEVAINKNKNSYYAFTNLTSDAKVQRAITHLHGFTLDGQPLTIERPIDASARLEIARNCPYRVFFGNLASRTTLEEWEKLVFAIEPSAWGFALHQATTGRFAFANVESVQQIENAVFLLDKVLLNGKPVKVMRAEGGEAPWRSSNVEAGSDGGRRSSRGDWYAQEYSRYASDRREWEPRSPLRPRRRSSRSLSPRRPSLARSDPPLLVPSRLPQQYLNAQDSLSRPLHPPSSLDVDKDRLSTLNLSAADLRTIETLWDPLARPPYPSFSRTTSVSTIFGYLSPSDAVDALKLPPPSFVADDPARKERYEGWLRSQTGDKGRYLAMMGQLMCFSRCQEEFGRMAKEDAEAVVLAHRD